MNQYSAQKIITIFGGTGFVGRSIVRRLAQAGHQVRVATRVRDHALRLKTAGAVGQITPIELAGFDPLSLHKAIVGSDIVINCIGILFERGAESYQGNFQRVHVDLARRIAETAQTAGCSRFIHLSALGASITSRSRYAKSKAEGEAAVRSAFPRATILRPSVIFGPDDNFLNMFAGLAKIFPALPLVGGGKTRFQPIFVGDVAAAVEAALAQDKTCGRIYELGGPATYCFRDLLAYTLAQTGQSRPLVSLPFGLAKLKAFILNLLPNPLLTPDQVELLKADNVVGQGALTLTDLGIIPTALEAVAPAWLRRFRPGGMFKWVAS